VAASLVAAEKNACAGMSSAELEHTPFFKRDEIAWVEPYRKDDKLRGARIAFRKLPGRSANQLAQAIQCHQARAAVTGYAPTFRSYCPASLEDVSVDVQMTGAAIVVTLSSARDDIATAILGRALNLVDGTSS
jgi:hypothetical protein